MKDYSPLLKGVNTSLSCCETRMNVVLLLSSFSLDAPTYVHVDRTPPSTSSTVFSTGPRYSISTVLPSEALQFQPLQINNYILNHFLCAESSCCFQRVLAIAILSICLSVRLSHGWISQKR